MSLSFRNCKVDLDVWHEALSCWNLPSGNCSHRNGKRCVHNTSRYATLFSQAHSTLLSLLAFLIIWQYRLPWIVHPSSVLVLMVGLETEGSRALRIFTSWAAVVSSSSCICSSSWQAFQVSAWSVNHCLGDGKSFVSSDCRPHHLLGDLKSFCCQDMRNISIRHSLLKVKLYDLLLTVSRQKSLFSATETKESIKKASIARSNN